MSLLILRVHWRERLVWQLGERRDTKDIKRLAPEDLATLLTKPFDAAELLAALQQALAVPGEIGRQLGSVPPELEPREPV